MIQGKRVGVVIPAAGKGSRMRGEAHKQLLHLAGTPIALHTLRRFEQSKIVDTIVVAAGSDILNTIVDLIRDDRLSKVACVVAGGAERQDSVWNGLQNLQSHHVDLVIVHDVVRPFITEEMLNRVIEAALDCGGAILAVRPKETVKMNTEDGTTLSTLPREKLWLAQTPQVFEFDLLYGAFQRAMEDNFYGTDDASLVERFGGCVRIVEGNYDNIKITTPEDLELAHLIAKRWNIA